MTSTDMRGKLVKRIPGPREFYCDYGLRYPASMGASKGEVLKSILKGVYFDNNRQPFGGCFRDALRYAGFSDYKEAMVVEGQNAVAPRRDCYEVGGFAVSPLSILKRTRSALAQACCIFPGGTSPGASLRF